MIQKLDILQLKIPPLIVVLICAGFIWLLSDAFPQLTIRGSMSVYVAGLLVSVGILMEFVSVVYFFRAKTTVNPVKPERSTQLVTAGLYRITRNPMYVGMLLLLTGYTIWKGNPLGILALWAFTVYMTTFQIKPEEGILLQHFGDAYTDYKKRVRRWL